jgi:uncharacterized protein
MARAVRLVLLALLVAIRAGALTVDDPGTFVVDRAGVFAQDQARLQATEALLAQLERKCGAQVKLLTAPNLDGEDLFGFAQRHYDRWKLGRAGKDDGALIVFALADRQIRIHTGYGLEGALPDSWCGSLWRSIASDYLKGGRYSEGLAAMASAIAQEVANAANVSLDGAAPRFTPPAGQDQPFPWMWIVFVIAMILFSIMRGRRRPRRTWLGGIGGFGGGGWGGGGSFGGGFGGGGGSFGGGGRSGGGGAGGSW